VEDGRVEMVAGYRGVPAESFHGVCVILKLIRIIDIKNPVHISTERTLARDRKSRPFFKVDEICCYERRQFEDFELTLRPEVIDNVVYVLAPRDKVL